MADIIDLTRADHRHIMIWQAELRERGHQGSGAGARQALASTWNTVPVASSGASGSLASPVAPGLPVARICEQVIAKVLGDGYADMANIQLADPASRALRIIAQAGFGSEFLEFFEIVHTEESACGVALVKARPVWVPDVARSPIFAGTPAEHIVLGADVRSVASVPVLARDGNLIAVISTHRRKPGRWTEPQRRHLEAVAAQTGQLLSRAS